MAGPAHQRGAGGYVIRDGRWVLAEPSAPVVRRLPGGHAPDTPVEVSGTAPERTEEPDPPWDALGESDASETLPEGKKRCPDCAKAVAYYPTTGTLYTHACRVPDPGPDLTF